MRTHVYLSPHLDDAVYSCGGLIAQQIDQDAHVAIVTLCAGDAPAGELSPFAAALHSHWAAGASPIVIRRAEDLAACARLGAQALHLDLQDAIYRRGADGMWLYQTHEAIFGPLHPAEGPLVDRVAEMLSPHCPAKAEMYCPLGIGGHADHRLMRMAAERLGRRLWYYSDFPYAARGEGLPDEFSLPQREVRLRPIAPWAVAAWTEAAALYESQLTVFWEDATDLERELQSYIKEAGGLRLYRSPAKAQQSLVSFPACDS
jgi:LmbE family N-acetylglucosaminyl deacetylase